MNRLAQAAALAVGLHGVLFWAGGPRTRPVLPLARSQSLTLNLVSVQAIVEKVPARAPKINPPPPKPKPNPRLPQKPAPKPVARRQPAPRPPEPEPMPAPPSAVEEPQASTEAEQPSMEIETASPVDPGPVSDQERAAVRESVPLYDRNPPPVYPRVARRRNYQGTVLLDVRVTVKGTVAEVKVAQSSGYSVLDSSALSSVHNWRFEPARRGSRPIETWVQVPVRFELR